MSDEKWQPYSADDHAAAHRAARVLAAAERYRRAYAAEKAAAVVHDTASSDACALSARVAAGDAWLAAWRERCAAHDVLEAAARGDL